jgi:hypothetical protein
MNNFFEDLKKYFETTPREEVLKDWAESEEFDKIGLTFKEFSEISQKHYTTVISSSPNFGNLQNLINQYSPKFDFGLFFN